MKPHARIMQLLIPPIAFGCMVMLNVASADTNPAATPDEQEQISTRSGTRELEPRLPLTELRMFTEAFNHISRAYVEEVDDRTLLEYAIRGMLTELDPHSTYLDGDAFADLQESTTGHYGGLGMEIDIEDGQVRVIAPIDDTPASRAGIKSGDLIVKLDDMPMRGIDLSAAIEAMRGEPGTDITLSVLHAGTSEPEEITLTREIIKITSVRHRIIENNYGYLRIAQFQAGTGGEVERAVAALQEDKTLQGLIIDLRNNPGGVLQSAVKVADVFVDSGLIVSTRGRINGADARYDASQPDATNGIPIVILVNEGTASAAEIVAGALQDHKRAVIMGTSTFGKGSVQTILPLSRNQAVKLTTARYYTPNGRSIQAEGIMPDIWVSQSKVTPIGFDAWRVKEKNLPKHLPGGQADKSDSTGKEGDMALARKDYQLNEALILLKGISIIATSTPS